MAGGGSGEAPSLEGILLERRDRAVWLTLDRPDAGNAFDMALVQGLKRAALWCLKRDDLDAVVVAGAGAAFSLGGDLDALRAGAADPDLLEPTIGALAAELAEAISALRELPCPVIAALDGRAGGAGLSLALACDVRVASDRAVLDFAYARVGATPDGGMTWLLPRILGESRALELMIESPIVRAERALHLGLVSEVVPRARLEEFVRTLIGRFAKHPSHYVPEVKALARSASATDLASQMETERRVLLRSLRRDEARQRVLRLAAAKGEHPSGLH